jgi:acyl transferase domain-containing protein
MASLSLIVWRRALSPDGRSYSYDQKAAGFGRGEGAACLLVKRMDLAIRDGDPIHAVIRGTACNHVGRSEGITMPRRSAQEQLLWDVHAIAGLSPSTTPVVEVCHFPCRCLLCYLQ